MLQASAQENLARSTNRLAKREAWPRRSLLKSSTTKADSFRGLVMPGRRPFSRGIPKPPGFSPPLSAPGDGLDEGVVSWVLQEAARRHGERLRWSAKQSLPAWELTVRRERRLKIPNRRTGQRPPGEFFSHMPS